MRLRAATETDRDAVRALLEGAALEAEFVPNEFRVAERDGAIVATARLKPLEGGAQELASVAVRADLRGQGIGEALVRDTLARAGPEVYALALAPGFFARVGFHALAATPAALREKAEGMCASTGFVAMRFKR